MVRGYAYLPQEEEEKNFLDRDQAEPTERPSKGLTRLIRWSIIIIVICSLADVVALLYLASGKVLARPVSVDDLPFRSTYIHLEDLYLKKNHKSTPHKPIVNLPKTQLLVNATEPERVYPQWAQSWTTPHGVVPINDRRLLVTPSISTIAQFRVIDFGMERCSITLKIPYNNETSTNADTWREKRQQEQNQIHVWGLKQSKSKKLDHRQLSWNTKPQRERHFGSFKLAPGTTQELASFPCSSGDYILFEFGCLSPECYFDMTAIAKTPIGVYLTQYQTI